MYGSRLERHPTPWTRLTVVLLMVAVYAALIAGVLSLASDPRARDLRLALVGFTMMCALMWVMASVRAPRTDAIVLGKAKRRQRSPSRSLPIVLALAIPLASAAALVQAVGPDGERGRWASEAHAAGGGSYEVPIEKVVNAPRPTGVKVVSSAGRHRVCSQSGR